MLKKSGVSERTFQRILTSLREKNILKKQKSEDGKNFFYFNPYFSKRGAKIDVETEKMFDNTERKADNQG